MKVQFLVAQSLSKTIKIKMSQYIYNDSQSAFNGYTGNLLSEWFNFDSCCSRYPCAAVTLSDINWAVCPQFMRETHAAQ